MQAVGSRLAHLAIWAAIAEADTHEGDFDIGADDQKVLDRNHENPALDRCKADACDVLGLMAVHDWSRLPTNPVTVCKRTYNSMCT